MCVCVRQSNKIEGGGGLPLRMTPPWPFRTSPHCASTEPCGETHRQQELQMFIIKRSRLPCVRSSLVISGRCSPLKCPATSLWAPSPKHCRPFCFLFNSSFVLAHLLEPASELLSWGFTNRLFPHGFVLVADF